VEIFAQMANNLPLLDGTIVHSNKRLHRFLSLHGSESPFSLHVSRIFGLPEFILCSAANRSESPSSCFVLPSRQAKASPKCGMTMEKQDWDCERFIRSAEEEEQTQPAYRSS
jgi:hypothetical protein